MVKTISYACLGAAILLGVVACNKTQKLQTADLPRVENISFKIGDDNLECYGSTSYSASGIIDGKQCMIAYNNKLHTIDIFDLDNQTPLKVITLQKEGPDQIGNPTGMGFYDNSLVIAHEPGICRLSLDGKIISKIKLEDLPQVKDQGYAQSIPELRTYFSTYNFMGFDPVTGQVALSLYKLEKENGRYPKKIVVLSCEDWKQTGEVDVVDPDFISAKPIAALGAVHATPGKDRVIYNYPASSKIFIADLKTNTVQEYDIPSTVAEPLYQLSDDPQDQGIATGYYYPLSYDPVRNVFWRIQQLPVDGLGIAGKNFSVSCILPDLSDHKEYRIPAREMIYPDPIYARSMILFPRADYRKLVAEHLCFYGLEWKTE